MKNWIFAFFFAATFVLQSTAADVQSGLNADKHAAKGITCQMCHGQNNQIKEPGINQCKTCHTPKDLAKKTKPKSTGDRNPHYSPHYEDQLDCTNCHHGHKEFEDFCNQCH